MTQFLGLARSVALAAAIACVFAAGLVGGPSAGLAGKKPSQQQSAQGSQPQGSPESQDEAQKKQAAAAARQAYDAGLKDFANGRYQNAIDQLSTALKAGGLSSTEMAKALYTRGIAYKKQNRPGLAISDLTSALWLKNGLSGNERETATAERVDAYRMAGLQDTGKGAERVIADSDTGPTTSSAGLSAAAIAEAAASGPNGGAGSNAAPITRQDPASEAAQDAARARAAYAPVDEGGLQSAATSTVVSAAATSPPAQATSSFGLAPTPEPAAGSNVAAGTPSSATGSGLSAVPAAVTGFFSNIFGGGTSAPAAAPQASVTTASTTPVEPATSSWSNATVVTDAGAKVTSKNGKQASRTQAAAQPAARKGKYKVHIAALRSRSEAEALAKQLVAQHGADLSDHPPTVDEAVIGSMGTFYRVRIGGYASQEEPRSLCNKLRTSGLDCLVVTN